MVFCNNSKQMWYKTEPHVTILILIDGFLQFRHEGVFTGTREVTILILIDGFLQYLNDFLYGYHSYSHNPYFNRWFSAIQQKVINMNIRMKSQSLF